MFEKAENKRKRGRDGLIFKKNTQYLTSNNYNIFIPVVPYFKTKKISDLRLVVYV